MDCETCTCFADDVVASSVGQISGARVEFRLTHAKRFRRLSDLGRGCGDLVNDDDQADQQPQLPPNDILPIRPCQTLQSSQLNSFLQIPLILSHITYPPK